MAYLLPTSSCLFAHTVDILYFFYCVIDLFNVYSMCNSGVVVCVTLPCFILARSQLQMRTCSQLAYLVK